MQNICKTSGLLRIMVLDRWCYIDGRSARVLPLQQNVSRYGAKTDCSKDITNYVNTEVTQIVLCQFSNKVYVVYPTKVLVVYESNGIPACVKKDLHCSSSCSTIFTKEFNTNVFLKAQWVNQMQHDNALCIWYYIWNGNPELPFFHIIMIYSRG